MRYFVPVIHPAATFRQPAALGPLVAHIENFVRRATKGVAPPPKLYINPKVKVLRRLVRWCRRSGAPLSVDVETGKWGHLAPFAELRAVGVGVARAAGIGLSWRWPLEPDVFEELRRAFIDKRITKLCMNGISYDVPILTRYGLPFAGPYEDIRDLCHANASTMRVALAVQASIHLCIGPWKAEADEGDENDPEGKGYVGEHTPIAKLLPYNAEDTIRAAQVRVHLRREIKRGGSDGERIERIYRQSLRLSQVASDMHHRGFPFDRGQQNALRRELRGIFERESQDLRRRLKSRAPHFRISDKGGTNDDDLRALIYTECKRPGIKSFGLQVPLTEVMWTDGGKPAVNKDALLYLFSLDNTPQELKELIKSHWRVDAPLKLLSTYIDSKFIMESLGPDGRMHPGVNSCGAETYRWTCSRPNLFNIPEQRTEEDESIRGVLPNIRSMYVAPPGYVIVNRDYKQLELWVMAYRTEDVALLRMLRKGQEWAEQHPDQAKMYDVHTQRARAFFGMPDDSKVPSAIRRQGKVVGLQSQYGAGVESVYLTTLEQIQDAVFDEIEAIWRRFPVTHEGIAASWTTQTDFARENGFNESGIMQYRRYYPPDAILKPTECSNYHIQATAAAIANSTMVGTDEGNKSRGLYYRLKREYPDAWIAMHVYDSFSVLCRERDEKGVNQLIEDCMKGPWVAGSSPELFGSDGKVGQRWSEV
jgi:hypothetical protein